MAFLLTFSGGASATYKDAVRVASDSQLTLSGAHPLTIDGIALVDKNRVLLRGQTASAENGIYVYNVSGGNYTLTRALDANSDKEVLPNMLVPVSAGTANADKIFQLVSPSVAPIDLDVDNLVFTDVLIGLANKADRDLTNLLPTSINQSLLFGDDTSYNIGAAGASRPQTLYVKQAINLDSLTANSILGSNASKNMVALSGATATSYLDPFTSSLQGVVPASGGGTANFLRADGTWAPGTPVADPALDVGKVLATDGTDASWRYAGLGDGSFGTNNVILGRAKPSLATGTKLTLIGPTAGEGLSTGKINILIGNIGTSLTTGSGNIFIGQDYFDGEPQSGWQPDANAFGSVGIGLSLRVTKSFCVGIGRFAEAFNYGVAIGANAAAGTVGAYGGTANVSVGSGAVCYSGDNSVAIGNNSLCNASNQVVIGAFSKAGGNFNTGSQKTVIVGNSSGKDSLTGNFNTVVGSDSFNNASLSTAANNTIVGQGSGAALTTGFDNVIVGQGCGTSLTTGNQNVLIGNNAQVTQAGVGRAVAIGKGAVADTFSVAIGEQAVASGSESTTVGILAKATHAYSIAIGGEAQAQAPETIQIGGSSFNNVANSCAIGGHLVKISTVFIGIGASGQSFGYPVKIMPQRPDAVANRDLSAGTLTLAGSQSTGSALGSAVIIATAPAGVAGGTTANAHVERLRVTADGIVKISCGEKHASIHGLTANYTATINNYYIGVDTSSAAITVNLPAVGAAGPGFVLVIKDENGTAATNAIVIDGNSSETIDGAPTQTINTNYGSVSLMCSGSAWFIM